MRKEKKESKECTVEYVAKTNLKLERIKNYGEKQ